MLQTVENKELNLLLQPDFLQEKSIMVAEDDETNYFLIKEYLEFSGVNLIWVKDGQEAVDFVQNSLHQVDLILMDIQMPVMNGFDALKAIKIINPSIPIIALTAYAIVGDQEKGLKAGFHAYLVKPVFRKTLMENIMRFF